MTRSPKRLAVYDYFKAVALVAAIYVHLSWYCFPKFPCAFIVGRIPSALFCLLCGYMAARTFRAHPPFYFFIRGAMLILTHVFFRLLTGPLPDVMVPSIFFVMGMSLFVFVIFEKMRIPSAGPLAAALVSVVLYTGSPQMISLSFFASCFFGYFWAKQAELVGSPIFFLGGAALTATAAFYQQAYWHLLFFFALVPFLFGFFERRLTFLPAIVETFSRHSLELFIISFFVTYHPLSMLFDRSSMQNAVLFAAVFLAFTSLSYLWARVYSRRPLEATAALLAFAPFYGIRAVFLVLAILSYRAFGKLRQASFVRYSRAESPPVAS